MPAILLVLAPVLPFLEQALLSLAARPKIRALIDEVVEAAVSKVFQVIFLKQTEDPKLVAAMAALHAEYAAATTLEEKQNVQDKINALPHTFK
jgi:hypothetical protein